MFTEKLLHSSPSFFSFIHNHANQGTPCLKVNWIKNLIEAENIDIMKLPAQSPDLNLIE